MDISCLSCIEYFLFAAFVEEVSEDRSWPGSCEGGFSPPQVEVVDQLKIGVVWRIFLMSNSQQLITSNYWQYEWLSGNRIVEVTTQTEIHPPDQISTSDQINLCWSLIASRCWQHEWLLCGYKTHSPQTDTHHSDQVSTSNLVQPPPISFYSQMTRNDNMNLDNVRKLNSPFSFTKK